MIPFIVVWSVWCITEILLSRFFRSGNLNEENRDKKTLSIIWTSILLSIFFGVLSNNLVHLPISHKKALPYSGLIIIFLGMLLRFISIRTLGKFFTVDIAIHKDQKIIKTGIYRYIRHPAYASSLLEFIGFGLSLNSWISLPVVIIPVTAAFIYRIKVEENLLKDQFGDEYSEYMNSTYRLFPWIY